MGLDQWLCKRPSINDDGADEKKIYWRKCNQIHGYFDRLYGGIENLQVYPVSIDDIRNLRNLCQKVIDNPSLAEELLPTMEGCFYGSCEYDTIYFHDLNYTINKINELLINDNNDEYYYQSWW